MRLAEFFSNPQQQCSYYKDRNSYFRYFYIENCSSHFCHGLIERGWRRFGQYFFVPICASCNECISIRQLPLIFNPTTSQKRVLNKNKHTIITISRPSLSQEKLDLYDTYHKVMNLKKGWNYNKISVKTYSEDFVRGYCDFGYEITYRIQDKLVGVGYFDIFDEAISSTYFFYDHSFASLSLGSFNILTQLLIAKSKNIKYFYPGYWIKNHYSMGYKEKFQPFEILTNQPDIFETPIWLPYLHTKDNHEHD